LESVALDFENNRSDGTEVAIIDIFCLAILCKLGYMVLITSHASNGEVFKLLITGFAKKS